MAAMTFRELVDSIRAKAGKSVTRVLTEISPRADICMQSLRAAYHDNAVLPETAHRLLRWCASEHPSVELGLIHLLVSPRRKPAKVDWFERAEHAIGMALKQAGVGDGSMVVLCREGGVWSVQVDDGWRLYGAGLNECLRSAKEDVDGV
jgi:hypothetical protein